LVSINAVVLDSGVEDNEQGGPGEGWMGISYCQQFLFSPTSLQASLVVDDVGGLEERGSIEDPNLR